MFSVLAALLALTIVHDATARKAHRAHECKLGDIDITSLKPVEVIRNENWIGHGSQELYTWVVGFCSAVLEAPVGNDECEWEGGKGYLQQFHGSTCASDFNVWGRLHKIENGVRIVAAQHSRHHNKTANIDVICDKDAAGEEPEPDMQEVQITDDPKNPKHLIYSLRFRSKCACPGSPCGHTPPPALKYEMERPPTSMFKTCALKDIDLGILNNKPYYFDAQELHQNGERVPFQWAFGWCSPVWDPKGVTDPCPMEDGVGYLQQFSGGKCISSFTNFYHFGEVADPVGAEIQLYDTRGTHAKLAKIEVLCDPTASSPRLKENLVTVESDKDEFGDKQYVYHMTIYHKCACPNQCFDTGEEQTPDEQPYNNWEDQQWDPAEGEEQWNPEGNDYNDETYENGYQYEDYPEGPTVVDWETRVQTCMVDGVDLRPLAAKSFVQGQDWIGHTNFPAQYMWIIGFCSPIANSPDGKDPCYQAEGMGYVQQFGHKNEHAPDACAADWTVWKGIEKTSHGVKITVENTPDRKVHRRAIVNVECDENGTPGHSHQSDHSDIKLVSDEDDTIVYNFNLKSKCACNGGCDLERDCRVGNMYIGDLLPKDNILETQRGGEGDEHTWLFGWCQKLKEGSRAIASLSEADPCSEPGFVQQFGDGYCIHNFYKNFNMYHAQNGLIIEAEADADFEGNHIARVRLVCDRSLKPGDLHHSSQVEVTQDRDGTTYYYTVSFRSLCACDGGCINLKPGDKPQPLPLPPPEESDLPEMHHCKWGSGDNAVDMSGVPTWEGVVKQRYNGDHTDFVWVVGWCNEIYQAPTGMTPCDVSEGAGYVQQYDTTTDAKGCQADFKHGYHVKVSKEPGKSVTFHYEVPKKGHHHAKKMDVVVTCDHNMLENTVELDEDVVEVKTVHDTNEYHMSFRSKCACKGGCKGHDKNLEERFGAPARDKLTMSVFKDMYDNAQLPPVVPCKIMDGYDEYDLRGLKQKEFILPQDKNGPEYTWVVGWCTPIIWTNAGVDVCSMKEGEGLVQQFRRGHCEESFGKFQNISLKYQSDGQKYIEINSTMLNSAEKVKKTARVQVYCDPHGKLWDAHHLDRNVPVTHVDSHHVEYLFRFRSKCACAGGCGALALHEHFWNGTKEAARHNKKCVVDGVDLSKLPPFEWVATQEYHKLAQDSKPTYEEYYWYMDLCHPLDSPPAGKEACNKHGEPAGFFQQFNQDKCVADFNIGGIENATRLKDLNGIEVLLTDSRHGHHKKDVRIRVICDKSVQSGTYKHNESTIQVNELSASTIHYSVTFYSSDVCGGGGCGIGCMVFVGLFTVFIVYLVVGSAFNKFVAGKEGIEIVPNLDLWLGLPGLVGGCFSSLSACKIGRGGGDYDAVPTADDDADDGGMESDAYL
eukprot:TRINITY_DN63929_c0_g1_i1.p1 TRINITY_DN63929_c0_g1~~TRINITY_DN63929_c0_g1_i1.p1  ORF type:complete len:1396 (+),score=251.95 TRINITY_DN63929_c0_g1_i1:41-4189(+)